MKFPALNAEEKAFLAAATDEPKILGNLSERVRGRMTACLGVPVRVSGARVIQPANPKMGKAPKIAASREAENAWISARFGGGPVSGRQVSAGLSQSLMRILKRALAESVINLGNGVAWPEAFRLELRIQEQEGAVEFFCEPRHLMGWAKEELERIR